MVKIYIADASSLKDEDLYKKLYRSLDARRRAKADRFLFPKDKRLCVGAGALLMHALQEENILDFSIALHANGKPYLVGEQNLYFNLSHAEDMVMCVISDQEAGCDVEKIAAFDKKLADYMMTQKEIKQIYSFLDQKEQQVMFFRLWTLKESYMKATGLGLKLEPGTFAMTVEKDRICAMPPADDRDFYFKEYFMGDEYCFSCCSLENQFCETMTEVDFKEFK